VYEAIRYFTERRKICYVHFRNVRGKVPHYQEVFIDEGDMDMIKAMQIYYENGFDGVFIPDHTPATSCAAPWHAGMAFALGYMRAILKHLGAV
jgi:mannonate dehydratase